MIEKIITGFLILLALKGQTNSPFELKPVRDISIISATTLLAIGGYVIPGKDKSLSANQIPMFTRFDVNAFDRGATYNWSLNANQLSKYSMALGLAPLLPLALTSSSFWEDKIVIGVMAAETFLLAASLAQIAKISASRKRPFVYNQHVDAKYKLENRAKESFFSRTTTMAFAFSVFSATMFDAYQPNNPYSHWVWAGTLGLATYTGYLKFHSGQHFPTDIIAGALVGSFIGWAVPALHRTSQNTISLGIYPYQNGFNGVVMLRL